MLDSDHGGGDAGGGDAPVVAPADNACPSHTHVEITDPTTGLKAVFERSFEQGEDGVMRPILKRILQRTKERLS